MLNRNDLARRGEAVECLRAGDNDGYSIRTVHIQLPLAWARLADCRIIRTHLGEPVLRWERGA